MSISYRHHLYHRIGIVLLPSKSKHVYSCNSRHSLHLRGEGSPKDLLYILVSYQSSYILSTERANLNAARSSWEFGGKRTLLAAHVSKANTGAFLPQSSDVTNRFRPIGGHVISVDAFVYPTYPPSSHKQSILTDPNSGTSLPQVSKKGFQNGTQMDSKEVPERLISRN